MSRRNAIKAVLSEGMAVTTVAARFGVSRATLHRWLRAFDPARPIASARPRKRGPKGPRWDDETVAAVSDIISDHPDWWGRRRVAAALADLGIVVSERTVGDILPVARDRLARQQAAQQRVEQARRSRQVAAMIRRDERDAERREMVKRKLEEILVPGITPEDALARIAEALAAKRWKIQVKDLTPELREFADAYLRAVCAHPEDLADREKWMLDAHRLRPRDDGRAGALNNLVRRYKEGRLARADIPPELLLAVDAVTFRDGE